MPTVLRVYLSRASAPVGAMVLGVALLAACARTQAGREQPPHPAGSPAAASAAVVDTAPATGSSAVVAAAHGLPDAARAQDAVWMSWAAWAARLPAFQVDPAADQASVRAAVAAKGPPERLTTDIIPPPFNEAAYRQDPDAWCRTVTPGRVRQFLQTTDGAPDLEQLSLPVLDCPPRGSVEVRLRALPGAPVTFATQDMGVWDNGCVAITVRADAQGIARATYTATAGVSNRVGVLAACPVTAGQAVISIYVASAPASGP